ncbi:MAG TPA: hypothetical protein VIG97_02940 [Luteimonas sp.]
MIELHPQADALGVLGLPAIPYPVALPVFQAAVANDGELPLADMLHGLQLRAAHGADWQRLEAAMERLSELIAGDDARPVVTVRGDDWWLEIGPVDTAADCIALRRGDSLLALLADRGDGRLRLAGLHPLDGSAIALLLALSRIDGEDGAVSAGEAWTRACAIADAAGGTPVDDVTPFLVRMPVGLGPTADVPADGGMRRPACVAAELATWDTLRTPG